MVHPNKGFDSQLKVRSSPVMAGWKVPHPNARLTSYHTRRDAGQQWGGCAGTEAGKKTGCLLVVQLVPHNQNSFLIEASTYISAPSRMFDVILGTTS